MSGFNVLLYRIVMALIGACFLILRSVYRIPTHIILGIVCIKIESWVVEREIIVFRDIQYCIEGIQPSIIDDIAQILLNLVAQRNIAILIAEQNIDFCLSIAKRLYIMDTDKPLREITKDQLLQNKELMHEMLAI
ncbi:MAG: hypothetical protein AAF442_07300 [Pseudomonadota bacterium]